MKKFILFLLTIVWAIGAKANHLNFKPFEVEGEFSYSSVIAISEDALGRMWFGTREGLFYHDGKSFTSFYSKQGDNNSLTNSSIRCLYQEDNDKLWVGTENGVNCIDLKNLKIEQYFLADNMPAVIRTIFKGTDNNIWVFSSQGTHCFLDENNTFFKVSWVNEELAERVNKCFKNSKNQFLLATDNSGILNLNIEGKTLSAWGTEELKEFQINDIVEDGIGNYWIATSKSGLLRVDGKFKIQPFANKQIPKKLFSLCFFDEQTLLVTSDGDGAASVNISTGEVNPYHLEKTEDKRSVVYSAFKDSRGIVWLGAINGGAYTADEVSDRFVTLLGQENQQDITSSILDMLVLNNDELLLATDGDGLWKYNLKSKKKQLVPIEGVAVIKRLFKDYLGNVWCGTYREGLVMLDKKLKVAEYFPVVKSKDGAYSDDSVWAIDQAPNGDMWIGTLEQGLFYYDRKAKCFYSCQSDFSKGKLYASSITSMFHDSNKNFWIGTKSGLYRYEKGNSAFILYERNKQLSNEVIRCIEEDRKGRLWVGTENGLNCLKPNEVVQFYKSDGLTSNRVQGINEDVFGNIWVATTYGLNRLDNSGQIQKYLENDGLSANVFNYQGRDLANNKIVLPTTNGVTLFDPHRMSVQTDFPKVVFTSLSVNGKMVGHKKQEHISRLKELVLNYEERFFTIGFSALTFQNGVKNEYAYMLDGFNNDWVFAGKERIATYSNLPAGEYVFKVKASNSDGLLSEDFIQLEIIILPPWWDTWWANLIYLVLLIGVILFFREYTLKEERFNSQLLVKEAEVKRKGEVEKIKTEFFTNISHELRTPLSLIIAPITSLINRDKDMSGTQRQELYQTIQNNSERLLTLVNQLLDFRKLENGKLKPKVEQLNIESVITGVIKRFRHKAGDVTPTFKLDYCNEQANLWGDAAMFENVYYNLVSNSIKYAEDADVTVKIGCKQQNDEVLLWVEDNGIGIADDEKDKVFERFYQSSNHGMGTGIGLAFVKELVELHHGTIQLVDAEDGGLRCEMIFKQGNEHFPKDWLIVDNKKKEISEQVVESANVRKTSSSSKVKMLIVEDSAELREYLQNEFSSEFYVKTAVNGKDGLKELNNFYPEIIISDIMMPEMDGIEFCRKVKDKLTTSHIPVILLTAKSAEETQMEGYESGADIYVTKPFSIDLLRAQVNNLLKNREQLKKRFAETAKPDPDKIELSGVDKKMLNKLGTYIDKNIRNSELSIEQIADEVGISRGYFHKKMKSVTGMSPSEYIRNYRLRKAAELLKERELSIEEIAFEVGFSSASYFSRTFTRLFGVSPSKYLEK
ncbi:hybrid sensor histidine kinase/response regulator [Prolixibacteraceae bacterium JC049]|nr:hybrid sensor histidine kinase/response regulator [Prolixibacteraceae bacterium JC049]